MLRHTHAHHSSTRHDHGNFNTGLTCSLAAYIWWGLSPFYFHQLAGVPPLVTLAHRVVWSVALLVILITALRQWPDVKATCSRLSIWPWLLGSTALIAVNWGVYIYAVATDRVLQSSLGFFINPLVTVLLGLLFLGERMNRTQIAAATIAAAGLTYLTIVTGGLPWITIVLSLCFAVYGLLRKKAPVTPMTGVLIETAVLAPASLLYLLWAHSRPDATFNTPRLLLTLALAGVVTTVPMLWYIAAARRVPLVTLGFLQFLNPSIQFVSAILLGERFGRERAIAFGIVWIAVALFVADMIRRARSNAHVPDRDMPAGEISD
ncbi:MAG: EamA family transporter RarD [Phycisphaerales bacterium]|nr:EamA family transporter RarD [Planctomycetota bacterium]